MTPPHTLELPPAEVNVKPRVDGSDNGAPPRPLERKSALQRCSHQTMMWIRKIHLYSGLFMFPWVLLYGITGMFFNHPQSFTGGQVTAFQPAEFSNGLLDTLTPPEALAEQVVAAINRQRGNSESGLVVLSDVRQPEFNRYFQFSVDPAGTHVSHTVTIDPLTGAGEVRTQTVDEPHEAAAENPLTEVRFVDLPSESNTLLQAQTQVPALLAELGLPVAEATTGRLSPSISFSAVVDDVPCVVSCNLANGMITAVPESAPPTMDAKSFMQRLHLSRGYSPHWSIKSLWAVSVDAMFVSMVFWGLSGLFMWWQIKRTRWLGTGIIAASALTASLLVVGMHDSLSFAGGRGGGHGGGRGGPPVQGTFLEDRELNVTDGAESIGPFRGGRGRGMRGRGGALNGTDTATSAGELSGPDESDAELETMLLEYLESDPGE